VNGAAQEKARNTIDSLTNMIKNIEWISIGKHDHHINLHATLARLKTDTRFERIRSYLEGEYNPEITTEFDSISVLKLNTANDEWNVYKKFKLQ
jgi:2'-5' RNA ligase